MKSTFSTSVILLVIFAVIFAFSSASHASGEIEFEYVGVKGPNFWHLLSEDSAICETGKQQSPIDITDEDLKLLAEPPNPKFNDAFEVESTNNGNTVEISSGEEGVPLPAEITVEGEKYELQQFHFHTPSEHRVNGRHFDVEQHLVFQSETGKISVVAVFYNVGGKPSEFMKPITDDLPKCKDDKKKLKKVELSSLLEDIESITKAYTYSGSLTTPPCTEGVTWYVNQNAQEVSLNQFLGLRNVTGFNSRFTQLRIDDELPPSEPPVTEEQPPAGTEPTEVPAGTEPSSPTEVPAGTDTEPSTTDPNDPNAQQSPDPYYKFKRSLYSRRHLSRSRKLK